MNKLLYMLFIFIFLVDFIQSSIEILPHFITRVDDGLPAIIFCALAICFCKKKGLDINLKYVFILFLYFMIMFFGVLVNMTPTGAILLGIRHHIKHIPLFFLPAAYDFSPKQFKNQILFILPLLILQCPIAVFQRFYFIKKSIFTGDVVTGTLIGSGTLTIVMICSIAVVLAFYVRKKISLVFFLITSCCLFLPTTVNETKITIFILPIAILFPVLLNEKRISLVKLKRLFAISFIGIFLISGFIFIYDYYGKIKPVGQSANPSILDYLGDRDRLEKYLYSGEKDGGVGMRRFDTIYLGVRELTQDIGTLAFGIGLGNATSSASGFHSLDERSSRAVKYGSEKTAAMYVFWELGLLGVFVYIIFFVFLLKDALFLRKAGDIFGAFALGWCPVIIIMAACLFYINMIILNVLNFLFWYFSGIVAAKSISMTPRVDKYPVTNLLQNNS